MIINTKILHLPPYISTNWQQISTLYMDGSTLIMVGNDGNRMDVR